MDAKGKIGILTGGGDVPGLNSVIKSVVYRASELDRSVAGNPQGVGGADATSNQRTPEIDARYIRPLTRENTRAIDRSGGTVLHTSRTNPLKVPQRTGCRQTSRILSQCADTSEKALNFTPIVLRNLERLGIGCLIVIGGDDTLGFAATLSSKGFPRDCHSQDDGQRRARNRILHRLFDGDHARKGIDHAAADDTRLARAHRRISHFRPRRRVHGALHGLYDVRALLDPGISVRPGLLTQFLVEDKRNNPSNYSFVIASEGAVWAGKEWGTIRRSGRLRPSQESGHRPRVSRGTAPANGRGNDVERSDVRSAQRRSGRSGSSGGDHFRESRSRSGRATMCSGGWSRFAKAATRTRRCRTPRWGRGR